jgi:RND family efflux transporter MFP subunit
MENAMSLNREHNTDETTQPSRPRSGKAAVVGTVVVLLVAAAVVFRRQIQVLWEPPASASQSQPGDAGRTPSPAAERKVLYWYDPMHPSYRSERPGKAPDCGMDLVPAYDSSEEGMPNLPEKAFKVTPERQQLIGVQYGEVAFQPLSRTIRAVGRVVYDETRIARIHSKIEGWIERVYVDFTGKLVEKNQPLVSVYSPELVATQEEYLLALKARDRLGASPFGEVAAGASSLLDAARGRLELWDISKAQIEDLEKARKPTKALTLYSPVNGFVISRNAYERQRIMPETELYAVADLSTIWVLAEIYEFEAPLVRLGQPASMTLAYFPGRTYRGQVTYVYPQLDNMTRTLKVRVEFPNHDFALKPDMYANVELRIDYGRQLSVPQEAVLDSGLQQLVFVALDGGYFEPRQVRLGGKVDDRYIVLGGLKAGERIVTSGNFLLDSESQLKSAASGMGMPGMQHEPGSGEPEKQPPSSHSQHKPSVGQEKQVDPSRQISPSQHQKKPEEHKHD